ncbi:hypothetical protein PHJA_001025100 [Phtheirospermum japonicum]|uniref:TOD1/MUCI70 glycosyltransferase-like domain-containing protein n=1 Tax=Phtheirospermum japonicum TaxID=374723 RepID=A0A830BWX0_9LAMI|nr:hypothetical protein PHJA_001025100 [Phtheirospermum japonicum]
MERKTHLAASLIQDNRPHLHDFEHGYSSSKRANHDHTKRTVWNWCSFKLIFVACTLWMFIILVALLFHFVHCQFSVRCFGISKIPMFMRNGGSLPNQQHRCPIPLSNDPNRVYIPENTSSDNIMKKLAYFTEDELSSSKRSKSFPLFGGHQTWRQRNESFKLNSSMKVHCGFMRNSGAEMNHVDMKYVKRCKFLVASGIFGEYDIPHQPSGISSRSKKMFCFLMIIDEKSLTFLKHNFTVRTDGEGGLWMGAWRFIVLSRLPYDEPRRNGKIPKILIHRLVPQARYSIWIDAKMTMTVDPLLMLERYLWQEGHTFAIAQHKYHRSVYEEADANKRRKRYCRPLIDRQMKIYYHEGMEPWSSKKNTTSDVPEGAIIIREHTALNNLFSCLWFNEVDLFTPRDQLSFGYVLYRLGASFKFFMFPNCEYNSLYLLHSHTREHSSPIENEPACNKPDGKYSKLKETRGGLGLWSRYPADLDLVVLPPVVRTSKAG